MINASLTYFTPINNWLGRLLINKRLSLNIGETSLICSKIIFCHCFKGWLLTRNSQESEFLLTLFDKIFDDLYHYINTTLSPKMETLQCNQIMQVKCKLKNKDNWWRNENIAIYFLWKIFFDLIFEGLQFTWGVDPKEGWQRHSSCFPPWETVYFCPDVEFRCIAGAGWSCKNGRIPFKTSKCSGFTSHQGRRDYIWICCGWPWYLNIFYHSEIEINICSQSY